MVEKGKAMDEQSPEGEKVPAPAVRFLKLEDVLMAEPPSLKSCASNWGGPACLVVTLSTLVALLLPNFVRARAQPGVSCKGNLKNIGTALEMYASDWGGNYPDGLWRLTPNYLRSIPACPDAGYVTYRADFGPDAKLNPDRYEDYYYVECCGENHKSVSVTGNYPAYNGIQGLIERMP